MPEDIAETYRTYEEFWPFYLRQHSKRGTRLMHIAGTFLALLSIAVALLSFKLIWLLLAPVIGYGIAWIAHGVIEKNHPATFSYPLWSLRGDLQMLRLWLTGRLEAELARQNILT